MTETQVVEILMRYAIELGYQWRLIKKDVPRVFFEAKVITIMKKDLILYHVLHEVAHILIGSSDKDEQDIAKHELLAEGISIVVRDVLGFAPHSRDEHYLQSWLNELHTTKHRFFSQHENVITKYAKIIAKRIRRECGTSVPFTGCKRQLATSRAHDSGDGKKHLRAGVRLCHALPDRVRRYDSVTTEGHDAPERLLKSAHHLARVC